MSESSFAHATATTALPLFPTHANLVGAEASERSLPGAKRGRLARACPERCAMENAFAPRDPGCLHPGAHTTQLGGSNVLAGCGNEKILDDSVEGLPTEGLTEQELLAQLLATSKGAVCASTLLRHFPSIGHVLSADVSELHSFGLLSNDIALLRLVRDIACRMAKAQVRDRPVLGNWGALIGYLQTAMAYEHVEQFRILFLDRKNKLIADEIQQRGTVSHTPVYPREVIKRALVVNASALIVVHNHPSGDPKPSRDDIEMTRQLKAAANALEVELHDHIVIGHGTHSSFRALGLL